MILCHPPKPASVGTLGGGQRYPAGYQFFGSDVWRIEVEGVLSVTSGTATVLYKGTVPFAPIAVRGNVTPVAVNNYQRCLPSCYNTTNGLYMVVVKMMTAGQLVIMQYTDAGRAPGFRGAQYRLQVDFIEN